MNAQVDEFLKQSTKWREELAELRSLLLACGLTEEFKWRAPCYTFEKRNVAILAALKESCTLSFFKGALLKDPHGLLSKPGENTRAARVIRFTSVKDAVELRPVLKAYIEEAIQVEKSGRKVESGDATDPALPKELQDKLDKLPALKRAFEMLTPGRQRGYVLDVAAAKQPKTRAARVEKHVQRILEGKGIHDCVCGLTKKPPGCDGSHKHLKTHQAK